MISLNGRPAWIWGVLAGFFAVGLVILALAQPPQVFDRPAWHDQGIRLWRDDVELKVYYRFSRWANEGGMPYTAGFEQAYPPLAVAYFALPRIFTADFGRYKALFPLFNAVLLGSLVGLSVWSLRRFGRPARLAALLLLPASLYFSFWRFDVLPAVLMALLVWSVMREKYGLAFYLLAAATAAKLYPAVFFIPLLMHIGSRRLPGAEMRRVVRALAIMILASAAAVAVLVFISGSGFLLDTLVMHLARKFELGSLAAVIITALSALLVPAGIGLRGVPLVLVLLQWAALVVLLFRGRLRGQAGFIRGCLFILMPMIMFNRFYSQQWVLWITPLYLPVARKRELIALAVFDLMNFLQFPILFGVDPYGAAFTVSTLVRSAVLAYLIYANGREMAAAGYLLKPRKVAAAAVPSPA